MILSTRLTWPISTSLPCSDRHEGHASLAGPVRGARWVPRAGPRRTGPVATESEVGRVFAARTARLVDSAR